jgi:uncharacterized protein (DUF58 family)
MYVSVRLAVVAVCLGVVAAFLPFPVWASLLVVNAVLAVLVVVDVRSAPPPSALRIHRDVPAVSSSTRTEVARVEVFNPLTRALEVGLRDAAPPSLGRSPRTHRVVVRPASRATVEAVLRPSRRGVAHLGPITVRTSGSLRLAGKQRALALTDRIKVYPPLPGRAHVAQRIERARALQIGTRSSAFRGGGNEFDSLRDYHPDDEFRRMDWRATARAGKPITKVYREERDQQLILLVDAGRSMASTLGDTSRFELAIDAGFTLAELATYVGDRVGMVAFGSRIERMIGPRSGREQPRRILDLLFDVEPTLDAPDYLRAFATVLGRYRRRALLVLFTELTDERAMVPLLEALPALRARHLVVVAAAQDPQVARLARRIPPDAAAAYSKAAAAESLAARDRTAARLRGMGIGVEDRPPTELAAAVADRYLAIKSAGRL